jgi:NADPH:quinone reductase-like Zn-dependent oxidoreductase
MRAVQITRFGGPEVLDVVDIAEPTPGEGQKLYDVSTAGVNYADTHQALSWEVDQRHSVTAGRGPGPRPSC